MSRPNSKSNETWMDHFERVEGLKHWDSGTKNNIFSCNYCGYNFDTNANTTDDLMHHIKSKHDITESKASEGMSECPHCDGEGSYEFRSYGKQSCSWCRGTGKLDEDQMDEFQQNEDKWNNIARMDNDTNLTTDSDIERWGESRSNEVKSGYTEEDYGEYLESMGMTEWKNLQHNDNDAFREGYNNWLDGLEKDGVNTGSYESKANENPTSDGYSWNADQDEMGRIQFHTDLTKEEKNREIEKIERRIQEQEDLELEEDTPRNRTGYFESKANEDVTFADVEQCPECNGTGEWKDVVDFDCPRCNGTGQLSKSKEVNGKYIINGMVIGKVTDFEPNNWFGKVELSEMPEFAEYGTLDPQAVVKGDDGMTYTDPKGGSDGSRGTLFDADGSPKPPIVSWGEVEAIAKEVDENEKDEIFQYLFELQDSGATNMMGASPYVEREFPHLDKKEVGNIVVEWMSNWDEIAQRMGIESRASEWKDPHEKAKKKLRNQGNSMGMDDINYGLQEPYNDSDESWNSVEAIAKEAISENEKDEMFQYLFDLQDSGITNMFGAGPYVEREFPHFDKKEVREVVLEWMHNYEAIHARMGISRESRANEKSIKQACKNAGISLSKAEKVAEMNGMDLQAVVDAGNLEEMLEDQRQDDDWYEREARAEFGNESAGSCKNCGRPISYGKLCDDCSDPDYEDDVDDTSASGELGTGLY